MSSPDQQLNVPTSAVNDLCINNKPNDNQQCDPNKMLENETVSCSENISSQEDDGNGQNVNTNGMNEIATTIEDNVNVYSNGEATVLDVKENEKSGPEVIEPNEIIQNDDAVGHDKNDRETGNDNFQNGNGYNFPALNNEVIPVPVEADQPHSVDPQISNETAPQTKTAEQSNPSETTDPTDGEDKDTLPCSQQDNSDVRNDAQNVSSNTNNELPESTASTSHVDDDEIERNDEASNDENDNFSDEHDSNEDSSEFPDIVDFDGTNEVENEEYILDTVVRKPRKERRRIVSVNDDDSDPENEVERQRLLRSPITIDENALADGGNDDKEEDDIEQLIQNEKPGPKSKKVSTQKLKELQTRQLLRNAIVIPSSSKKKKNRIIDSDDDEENASLLPYCVDVDDIGLPDTIEENDNDPDALEASSILLNDIVKPDSSVPVVSDLMDEQAIKTEPKDEKPSINSLISIESLEEVRKGSVDEMPVLVKEEHSDAIKIEKMDSGRMTNKQCKTEDESSTVNADFPPFSSSSSSDNEDEFIPNDVYFGTPDKKRGSRGNGGRARGAQPTPSSHREVKTVRTEARSTDKRRGTSRPSRSDKFIDNRRYSSASVSSSSSSESEDEYQKSKARRKPETVTIVKQPIQQLYHKNSLPIRPIQQQIQRQKQQQFQRQNQQRKRDRFYDKSQDIPNAIYFGDVDVPLHVLHAYDDSDSDSAVAKNLKNVTSNPLRFSSQVSKGRGRSNTMPHESGQLQNNARLTNTKSRSDSQKARGRPKVDSVSPSNDRSIQMMKTFLKAAGLKKVKLNRLWEGCKSNSERADKMLELLREKGLEGEPTISKCRQLKVDYLTKKEIEDLDPNLIIQAEGRTTRRSTRAATKRQYTYDEDEILETRTKLRNVIDSDSDFE